jgi:phosphate-selective porin OprO/OprP
VSDAFHLHVGKVTSVEGFENFQSNARILFAERSLANNMIPGREIGLKAVGSIGKVFSYGLTLTNGALDGCAMNSSANLSDDLLYSALVTIKPFAGDKDSPLAGLSIGLAASIGEEDTSIDGSTDRTLKYRTAGRNAFLTVQNGVAVKGDRHRLNPQLSYYYGPLGVLAEYVTSSYEMSRGGVAHTIDNSGWTVQASYVLTGENNTFGGVKPAHPFNLDGDGMGAFELGLRYNVFSGDEDLFSGTSSTMLASSSSVQDAEAFGILFKWHLSENLLGHSTTRSRTSTASEQNATQKRPSPHASR